MGRVTVHVSNRLHDRCCITIDTRQRRTRDRAAAIGSLERRDVRRCFSACSQRGVVGGRITVQIGNRLGNIRCRAINTRQRRTRDRAAAIGSLERRDVRRCFSACSQRGVVGGRITVQIGNRLGNIRCRAINTRQRRTRDRAAAIGSLERRDVRRCFSACRQRGVVGGRITVQIGNRLGNIRCRAINTRQRRTHDRATAIGSLERRDVRRCFSACSQRGVVGGRITVQIGNRLGNIRCRAINTRQRRTRDRAAAIGSLERRDVRRCFSACSQRGVVGGRITVQIGKSLGNLSRRTINTRQRRTRDRAAAVPAGSVEL